MQKPYMPPTSQTATKSPMCVVVFVRMCFLQSTKKYHVFRRGGWRKEYANVIAPYLSSGGTWRGSVEVEKRSLLERRGLSIDLASTRRSFILSIET